MVCRHVHIASAAGAQLSGEKSHQSQPDPLAKPKRLQQLPLRLFNRRLDCVDRGKGQDYTSVIHLSADTPKLYGTLPAGNAKEAPSHQWRITITIAFAAPPNRVTPLVFPRNVHAKLDFNGGS